MRSSYFTCYAYLGKGRRSQTPYQNHHVLAHLLNIKSQRCTLLRTLRLLFRAFVRYRCLSRPTATAANMDDKGDEELALGRTGRTVTFGNDENRAPRGERGRGRTSASHNRRRSASRDSIRSVRSRIDTSNSTVPIGFRTLSFQVSASRALDEEAQKPEHPTHGLKEGKHVGPQGKSQWFLHRCEVTMSKSYADICSTN